MLFVERAEKQKKRTGLCALGGFAVSKKWDKDMSQDEVTQIKVGNSSVGVIGLKAVIEDMAPEYEDKEDAEVGDALLARLAKRTFINNTVKAVGKVPPRNKLKQWLEEAQG